MCPSIHPIVTNFVCQLFGVVEVVYSEFILAFLLPTVTESEVDESGD